MKGDAYMFESMIREQIIKAICDSTTLVLISLADNEITYTDDHSFLDFEINTHVLDRKAMDYRQVNITGFVYNKGVKIISVRAK